MSTTVVTWKNLKGRKTLHKLHPAMLNPEGLTKTLGIRPVPHRADQPHGIYPVVFDRAYAVEKLVYEISDCGDVPFLDLVDLLAEAYTIVNPDAPIVGIMSEISSAVREVVYFDPLALSGSW